MPSISRQYGSDSKSTAPRQRVQTGAGPFMLTLWRSAAPVTTWLQLQRPRKAPAAASQEAREPVEHKSLTDTVVLRILETRGVAHSTNAPGDQNSAQIPLLRPEDTGTRRILKEAVVHGAPVSFAVQLHWSVQPIDLASIPALAIFREYTLYTTATRREGRRPCYFLRLGFFADAISAKQVAGYLRPEFASAAVVPVTEQERSRAKDGCIDSSSLAKTVHSIVWTFEPERLHPHTPPVNSGSILSAAEKTDHRLPAGSRSNARTLQQTLKALAAREMLMDPDSESGVRHVRFTVETRAPR